MKYEGTRYNSAWDASTWLILALIVAVSLWPVFIDGEWLLPAILAAVFLAFTLTAFMGIYYRIDGDKLVVYEFFRPTAFPIEKISEIRPSNSLLSSPATSLTRRIAIRFSDRKILKSTAPLIISPVRRDEFIARLLSVNPNIRC